MSLWDFETKEKMLTRMIGHSFGKNPVEKLNEIRASKHESANFIFSQLQPTPDDTAIEIGTGTGIIAGWMAPKVKQLHCCDISKSFLSVAEEECQAHSNVSFNLIQTGKLNFAAEASIDLIYSNNVFIHLNLYDISIYFREFQRVAKRGGKVWFDIANADAMAVNIPDHFQTMLGYYERNSDVGERSILIQFISSAAVIAIAKSFGFSLVHSVGDHYRYFLFTKD